MKKTHPILPLAAVFALALFQGCGTKPVLVTPDPGSAGGPVGSEHVSPETSLARLNVSLRASPVGDTPQSLADNVGGQVAGALNRERFYVTDANPDITVDLQLQSELFDQSGNYFVYRGITNGRIVRVHDNVVIDSKILQSRGERALGDGLALQNLSAQVSGDAAGWVNNSLKVDAVGLAANDLRLTVPRTMVMRNYVNTFIEESTQTPGIVSSVLIAQDETARVVTFRVIYFPRDIPEGVLNRLRNNPRLSIR